MLKLLARLYISLNLLLNSFCCASNILAVFPHPGYSHFRVFYPILNALAVKGHNVTAVSYVTAPHAHKNYREYIIEGASVRKDIVDLSGERISRSMFAMYEEFYALWYEGQESCRRFFDSGLVDRILEDHRRSPFDLLIHEPFNTDCVLGLIELIKTPVVGLSSCALMPWHYARLGQPDWPSFIPSEFVGYSEKMSYTERFVNFIMTRSLNLLYRLAERDDNKIIYKYFKIDVDVRNLAAKTSLILVNQHYSLSGARPLSTQLIEIGGVHVDGLIEPLTDGNLKNFIENSVNGVIVISFGSIVKPSTIDSEKLLSIFTALKRLPYNVVWRWDDPTKISETNDGQIFYSSWISQKDVLCHPNVKLFWSHGGLLGVSESVYCGVPLIVTPIYGDQFLNGRAVENRNIGIVLDYHKINEKILYETFSEILKNDYKTNIQHVSHVYRNRQNRPLDTAIFWIEYVIENHGKSFLLRSHSVELNWFIYYSLDVIVVLLIIAGILLQIVKIILNKFFQSGKSQTKIKIS